MAKKAFEATSLRKLLTFLIVVVLLAAIGGFYLGLQYIRETAVEVSHATEDAKASGDQVEKLRVLQKQLTQAKSLVQKADKIFATEANYQTQSVKALQRYAKASGVTISKTDFTQTGDIASMPARTVTIELDNPVSYAKLLRFIELVEGSLPKMQVSSITISRPDAARGDNVNVGKIAIKVSVQ